jgi:hypothetical protein
MSHPPLVIPRTCSCGAFLPIRVSAWLQAHAETAPPETAVLTYRCHRPRHQYPCNTTITIRALDVRNARPDTRTAQVA